MSIPYFPIVPSEVIIKFKSLFFRFYFLNYWLTDCDGIAKFRGELLIFWGKDIIYVFFNLQKNYNVKEIIGSGRFGTVARIHDRVLNKDFALKKVPVYTTIQTIQAFKEGKNHRSFRHPNIVLLVGAWASLKGNSKSIKLCTRIR